MSRGGYVTSPEGSVARLERGGTRRADAAELFAERAGGSGCPGNGRAGGRRWAELSGGSTTGGALRQRYRGSLGGALQSRGLGRGHAAPWRWSADLLWRGGATAHSGGSPTHSRSRARRNRDMVVEHAAMRLAPGRRRAAAGEYLHDLADLACRWSELAAEPHLVRNRDGRAQAQAGRCRRRPRSRCGGEKTLIERGHTRGTALGLVVWCADEAGPFKAVPHPGRSWQPQGQPAGQPHEYVRAGTTKILTLFQPATGRVRIQPTACVTHVIFHPGLRTMLAEIVAALPDPAVSLTPAA